MKTRLLAAVVGLSFLIPALIWGGVVAVEIIAGVVLLLVVYEYASMAFPTDRNPQMGFLGVVVALSYGTALYGQANHWAIVLLLCMVASMVWVTARPGPELSGAADRFGRLAAGLGWLSLLTFLPLLRRLDSGLAWVFLVLAISWCGDTGGYFAGRTFGKHKLYERISPKKTWEGVVGGMALAVVGVFGVRALGLPELTPLDCVLLGTIVSFAGVVGDLSESMLKRSFDVKDAGNLLPGHGGFLDRIDSVLFVAPLVYGYAVLLKGVQP